jgi:hypothetical protein
MLLGSKRTNKKRFVSASLEIALLGWASRAHNSQGDATFSVAANTLLANHSQIDQQHLNEKAPA